MKAELEELILSGSMLSNIAFNLKQDETISENRRLVMDQTQAKWDHALGAFRRKQEQARSARRSAAKPSKSSTRRKS